MGPNGENPRSISFHETHEWTPALLPDGRLLYTRWDYVDRNGVLYHTSGRAARRRRRAYLLRQHTWNPCGTWEARPVPNSTKVMAIAGPHHAMSAGSVILIDTLKGIDGATPITRLTPEVRFTESEEPLAHAPAFVKDVAFDSTPRSYWRGGIPGPARNQTPTVQEKRWPGIRSRARGRSPKPRSSPRIPTTACWASQAATSRPVRHLPLRCRWHARTHLSRSAHLQPLARPIEPRTPPKLPNRLSIPNAQSA
ncbi:MAG: hypothetical protein ACOX7Q_08730 [Kiritimatiellia bacterium]